jgi:predicted transcriptional regulator
MGNVYIMKEIYQQSSLFQEKIDEVQNKLLLLYLIDKIDIPLSNSEISHFVLEENFMAYYVLQSTINDMIDDGYLEKIRDASQTRYFITSEGITTLEYFEKHLDIDIRTKIVQYVAKNRKDIKKEYETTANYFYDHTNNEFIVKCGLCEDEKTLMDIAVTVVTREQAKLICANWKKNVNQKYKKILDELIIKPEEEPKDEAGE